MKVNTKPDFYITEITRNTLKAYNSVIISTDVSKLPTAEKTVGVFFEPQLQGATLFESNEILDFFTKTDCVGHNEGNMFLLPYSLFREIEQLVLKKNGLL